MSALASTRSALACSGAMYEGVPKTTPPRDRFSAWLGELAPSRKLRHPEVEKPDVIGVIGQCLQEDVGGLQIAVSDPLAVGLGQPAQRLADDVESARG